MPNKKIFYLILIVGLAVVNLIAIGILINFGWQAYQNKQMIKEQSDKEQIARKEPVFSAKEAFTLVEPEAKRWQADAALFNLSAESLDKEGKAQEWMATFYSPEAKQTREFVVARQKVAAGEIYNFAISQFRNLEKWQDSTTLNLSGRAELYFDQSFNVWFWQVKTDKGVTTFEITELSSVL